jgi:hypothetical protein
MGKGLWPVPINRLTATEKKLDTPSIIQFHEPQPCESKNAMQDLPIIQKTYDLIQWYVPLLNNLPRSHRFILGDRIITGLYELLEALITARYESNKLPLLTPLNSKLDILRHQTRLLLDFELMPPHRYEYAGQRLNDIGTDLGGWIKHQRQRQP